ncbi:MAG: hypothetical protein IJ545_06090 [Alphaproteobacteria bacterium]|nr:hypothetical protein [Alphaproteobacteria bacterium]
MEIIIFYAALICALFLGLSYGILFIRKKTNLSSFKRFNKLESFLLKIPAPSVKILITLLIITAICLCWAEASYLTDLWLGRIALSVWNLGCLYLLAYIVYTIIHPYSLTKEAAWAFSDKYPCGHNIAGFILLVFLSAGLMWLLKVNGYEWNIAIFGISALADYAIFMTAYACFFIGKIILSLCKTIYKMAKWLNKAYWEWVLKQ